ncbi:MAG: shikimate dehydrogenase [Pseudomonadota bacterium]|nr:shikimate dehydrogenase [Pseudomonadota bacterium]
MLAQVITGQEIVAATQQVGLFELRLDYWQAIDMARVEKLIASTPLPVILTLRPMSEGGRYQGSESTRIAWLKKLITLSPAYIDLEHTVADGVIDELHAINPPVKIIRSYHHFTETPLDLTAALAALHHPAVHTYKLATLANSTLDALRMLVFVQQHDNVVGISMGEYGSCTRILAPVVGGCWTYASENEESAIAPGLLTIAEMVRIYRYSHLNLQTKIFGLIGNPVAQSDGHLFHNAYYQQHASNAVYVKFRLTKPELAEFFQLIKTLPIYGLSVTMPLKESVQPFVHQIDTTAEKVGAVNTLSIKNGKVFATNTDVMGVLQPLEQRTQLKAKSVLVIGAGGAARAVIYALRNAGASITIINRDTNKAALLAEKFDCRSDAKYFDIVINTIPDNQETSAFIQEIVNENVTSRTLAMDIVYKPRETRFIQHAKIRGAEIIYGEEMFLAQALEQAKLFQKN